MTPLFGRPVVEILKFHRAFQLVDTASTHKDVRNLSADSVDGMRMAASPGSDRNAIVSDCRDSNLFRIARPLPRTTLCEKVCQVNPRPANNLNPGGRGMM